jgi:hypothetical protein
MHTSDDVQVVPHPPQLASSEVVSTHPAAQQLSPPPHAVPLAAHTQSPSTHDEFSPQLRPHMPQFVGSLSRFLHPVSQHVADPVHAGANPHLHWDPAHALDVSGSQTLPQSPQLFVSAEVSMQNELSPNGQHLSGDVHPPAHSTTRASGRSSPPLSIRGSGLSSPPPAHPARAKTLPHSKTRRRFRIRHLVKPGLPQR